MYFWAKIRKVRPNARPCRGIREEDICNILQRDVIVNKEPTDAQKKILAQPGITAYTRALGTADEKEHFERHLRKYVHIYLPDCPFEIGTTHRYTILTAEACVIARKPIRAGDPIKYLSGIQVEMSEREEQELSSRTDFSIVLSSRRKRPSLFLGPARFANHDCDSNARLTTTGPHGIHIVARRNIAVGDEITVTYGDDYFGEDNCECLCATCESLTRNGWDPRGPVLHDDSCGVDPDEEDQRPRRKRRRATKPQTPTVKVEKAIAKPGPSMKRKREQEEPNSLPGHAGDVPKKRGRPRKMPVSEDAVDADYIRFARQFMARWFEQRARLSDVNANVDMQRVERAVNEELNDDDAQDMREQREQDALRDKPKHYRLFHQALKVLARAAEAQINALETTIRVVNDKTADLLRIDVQDVPRYYAPPGEEHHVPLPSLLEETKCKHEPEESTSSAIQLATPPASDKVVHYSDSDLSAGADTTIKVTTASRDGRLPSVKKQRPGSSLRHVINADQNGPEGDIFNVPPSPSSIDAHQSDHRPLKRKRGRPRKRPLPIEQDTDTYREAAAESSSAAEATQASTATDESSMSSVFSAESTRGRVSPTSSIGDADVFAAGSICQNIVELYTSGAGADEDVEVATALREQIDTEQKADGASERKKQMRRSARRANGSSATLDTVTSIERYPSRGPQAGEPQADSQRSDADEERRGPPRTPGDYHLTAALLLDTHSRWVECRNCDQHFVQNDAYQTRIACPRCERHSKLHGYYWPKTDRAGRDDREQRVLDHRTIHRFIEPEEERLEPKGRRTLLEVLRERDLGEQRRGSLEAESSRRSGSRDDNGSGSRRRSRRNI